MSAALTRLAALSLALGSVALAAPAIAHQIGLEHTHLETPWGDIVALGGVAAVVVGGLAILLLAVAPKQTRREGAQRERAVARARK